MMVAMLRNLHNITDWKAKHLHLYTGCAYSADVLLSGCIQGVGC